MNEYLNRLKRYHSANFKNAVGDEATGAVQPLDLNDRTITVEINPIVSTVAGTARVFGSNLGTDESYNTANNMTVVVPESSHTYVKNSIFGKPFRVKGILYTASSIAQLAKPFNIYTASIAGSTTSKTWQPSKYTAPTNYNALQVKTSEFQIVVDAEVRFEIAFLAGAYASMILSIQDVLDMSQALSNRTPIKSATR